MCILAFSLYFIDREPLLFRNGGRTTYPIFYFGAEVITQKEYGLNGNVCASVTSAYQTLLRVGGPRRKWEKIISERGEGRKKKEEVKERKDPT